MIAAIVAAACDAAPDAPAPDGAPPSASVVVGIDREDTTMSPVPSFLDAYDFENRIWYHDLPGRLEEISGLAFTVDGRLFAHDDERGRLHEIDPASAEVGKRFDVGDDLVRGDFEGLVIVEDRFFLVTSGAWLYEFREGEDREDVAYRVSDLGLGDGCEVEGLDYDPDLDALLLACKTTLPDRDVVVIHRVPMKPGAPPLPDLTVSRIDLGARGIDRSFAPSGVAVTPLGTVLLLSGRHDALIEVDREGRLITGVNLRAGRHPQSEGLAIGPDATIYISDEKNGKEPRLTAYGVHKTSGQVESS